MAKRVVVLGAGTEVGKTHVACILLRALRRASQPWSGVKPVESGIAPGKLRTSSDAARLAAASDKKLTRPRYLFVDAISPHLAARRANVVIELDEIAGWIGAFGERNLVIETAGGLMSPLGPNLANIDVAERVRPDGLLVVAADRLGALHDIASVMALLRVRWPALVQSGAVLVALSCPAKPDASTGTNAGELQTLGIADTVASITRASEQSSAHRDVAAQMTAWCRSLAPGTLRGL